LLGFAPLAGAPLAGTGVVAPVVLTRPLYGLYILAEQPIIYQGGNPISTVRATGNVFIGPESVRAADSYQLVFTTSAPDADGNTTTTSAWVEKPIAPATVPGDFYYRQLGMGTNETTGANQREQPAFTGFEIGTVEIAGATDVPPLRLAFQDIAVTLSPLSLQISLDPSIEHYANVIVGQFVSVTAPTNLPTVHIGEIDDTGYNKLINMSYRSYDPAGDLGEEFTAELGIIDTAIVFAERLQPQLLTALDSFGNPVSQEHTLLIGTMEICTVGVHVPTGGTAASPLQYIDEFGVEQNTTPTLTVNANNKSPVISSLPALKVRPISLTLSPLSAPVDPFAGGTYISATPAIDGQTTYTVGGSSTLPRKTLTTDAGSGFDITNPALGTEVGELDNQSSETELDTGFEIGPVAIAGAFERAGDSLEDHVHISDEWYYNDSNARTKILPYTSWYALIPVLNLSLTSTLNDAHEQPVDGLQIDGTAAEVTTQSYNTLVLPVENMGASGFGMTLVLNLQAGVQPNVTEILLDSTNTGISLSLGNLSVGVVTTIATSNAICVGLQLAFQTFASIVPPEVFGTANSFPPSQLLQLSTNLDDITLIAHANIEVDNGTGVRNSNDLLGFDLHFQEPAIGYLVTSALGDIQMNVGKILPIPLEVAVQMSAPQLNVLNPITGEETDHGFELYVQLAGTTAIGIIFDFETIKHLYVRGRLRYLPPRRRGLVLTRESPNMIKVAA
tara:strand:+ start:2781 stop:4973 length:2193 start_codon:yes stop_codon:yes gene_type:complete